MNQQQTFTNNSLFVGDLSKFVTEIDLEELFSNYGVVTEVKIKRNSATGKTLSYGFVTFADERSASYAMERTNGFNFYGRNLRVRWAVYNARSSRGAGRQDDVINSVYVRFITNKIHVYVTEQDFRSVFEPFGSVLDVAVKESSIDQRTSRQSGYGFVHFSTDAAGVFSAFRAVSTVDNATIDGVTFNVELSKNLMKQFNEQREVAQRRENVQPMPHLTGIPQSFVGTEYVGNKAVPAGLSTNMQSPTMHQSPMPLHGKQMHPGATPTFAPPHINTDKDSSFLPNPGNNNFAGANSMQSIATYQNGFGSANYMQHIPPNSAPFPVAPAPNATGNIPSLTSYSSDSYEGRLPVQMPTTFLGLGSMSNDSHDVHRQQSMPHTIQQPMPPPVHPCMPQPIPPAMQQPVQRQVPHSMQQNINHAVHPRMTTTGTQMQLTNPMSGISFTGDLRDARVDQNGMHMQQGNGINYMEDNQVFYNTYQMQQWSHQQLKHYAPQQHHHEVFTRQPQQIHSPHSYHDNLPPSVPGGFRNMESRKPHGGQRQSEKLHHREQDSMYRRLERNEQDHDRPVQIQHDYQERNLRRYGGDVGIAVESDTGSLSSDMQSGSKDKSNEVGSRRNMYGGIAPGEDEKSLGSISSHNSGSHSSSRVHQDSRTLMPISAGVQHSSESNNSLTPNRVHLRGKSRIRGPSAGNPDLMSKLPSVASQSDDTASGSQQNSGSLNTGSSSNIALSRSDSVDEHQFGSPGLFGLEGRIQKLELISEAVDTEESIADTASAASTHDMTSDILPSKQFENSSSKSRASAERTKQFESRSGSETGSSTLTNTMSWRNNSELRGQHVFTGVGSTSEVNKCANSLQKDSRKESPGVSYFELSASSGNSASEFDGALQGSHRGIEQGASGSSSTTLTGESHVYPYLSPQSTTNYGQDLSQALSLASSRSTSRTSTPTVASRRLPSREQSLTSLGSVHSTTPSIRHINSGHNLVESDALNALRLDSRSTTSSISDTRSVHESHRSNHGSAITVQAQQQLPHQQQESIEQLPYAQQRPYHQNQQGMDLQQRQYQQAHEQRINDSQHQLSHLSLSRSGSMSYGSESSPAFSDSRLHRSGSNSMIVGSRSRYGYELSSPPGLVIQIPPHRDSSASSASPSRSQVNIRTSGNEICLDHSYPIQQPISREKSSPRPPVHPGSSFFGGDEDGLDTCIRSFRNDGTDVRQEVTSPRLVHLRDLSNAEQLISLTGSQRRSRKKHVLQPFIGIEPELLRAGSMGSAQSFDMQETDLTNYSSPPFGQQNSNSALLGMLERASSVNSVDLSLPTSASGQRGSSIGSSLGSSTLGSESGHYGGDIGFRRYSPVLSPPAFDVAQNIPNSSSGASRVSVDSVTWRSIVQVTED